MGMDPARRPGTTPTLGVPDIAWAEARAAAVNALVNNKKWISVPPITLTGAAQIVASLPMVATSTGKFRTRLVGYVANAGTTNTISSSVSVGPASLVALYIGAPLFVFANPDEGSQNMATVAQIIDLPTQTFTAAPGSTTIVNALMESGGVGMSVLLNSIQFEVEEY